MKKEYKNFTINIDRASEVARAAVSMLEKKLPPFDNPHALPDTIIPASMQQGSLEHALLIFYACTTDAMRRADLVYEAFRNISQEVPLKDIPFLTKDELKQLVEKHLELISEKSMGKPVETLAYNSKKLNREYQGDPRKMAFNIFGNIIPIPAAIKRLTAFKQIGIGKAALIMKNFVRFGMWDYHTAEIPIKVDRHVIRISLGAEVIETQAEVLASDKLVKPLSQAYQEVTSTERISAVHLDDALWAIGSYLCKADSLASCQYSCRIGCQARPSSDSRAIWFYLGKDKREMTPSLFSVPIPKH